MEHPKFMSTGGFYRPDVSPCSCRRRKYSFSRQVGAGLKRNDHSGERKLACQRLPPFLEADSVPPICQCLFSYDTTSITGSLWALENKCGCFVMIFKAAWMKFELMLQRGNTNVGKPTLMTGIGGSKNIKFNMRMKGLNFSCKATQI